MDQKQYQQALNLEGFLEKKSPSIFKGFQKRHFAVRDKGQYLVYSKKKLLGNKIKPKALIPIESIKSIGKIKGSQREFVLQIGKRDILLKAESESVRDLWTSSIACLQEKLLLDKHLQTIRDQQQSFHSDRSENAKVTEKVFWKNLDSEIKASIMVDQEKQTIEDKIQEVEIKNEEVMKSKGLFAYLDKFDTNKFKQFVKCGFLYKKGKIASLTKAKRRWFIIISSFSLLGDDSNIQGPTQSDVPEPFKLNHLYYFSYEFRNDQSSFKGELTVSQIEEIELVNVDSNLAFLKHLRHSVTYGFKFKHKERHYHFFSESITEIKSWMSTLENLKEKLRITQIEDDEKELQIRKEDVLLQQQMQLKISRKLHKYKWFKRTVYLKKDTIIWTKQEQNDCENYILLISIKNVMSVGNDFHINTKDETIFKFRTNSEEIQKEWVNKIEFLMQNLKGEFKDLEKITQLPPEIKVQSNEQKKKNQNEKKNIVHEKNDDEILKNDEIASYYDNFFRQKKLEEQKNQQKKKASQTNKKSIFHKIFCCYAQEDEFDKGF